ncbi:hypothetical protein GCM10027402_25540 [Arthrobacter monumenti]
MKFKWEPNSFGRSGILATVEEGDTYPVASEFWLDLNLSKYHDDRFAAASALLFGHVTGARLAFTGRVSISVARSIEAIFPETVRVDPVLYSDREMPRGESTLIVCNGRKGVAPDNGLHKQREFVLEIVRSDVYSGGLLEMDALTLSSNAWLHSETQSGKLGRWYPFLAAGILLAEETSASAIFIDAPDIIEEPDFPLLSDLCSSVGLNLLTGGPVTR